MINAGAQIKPRKGVSKTTSASAPHPEDLIYRYNEDIPGLHITRSLGDSIAHRIGVEHTPDIFTEHLTVYDKFMVLASDKIWKYVSNEEVGQIVWEIYNDPTKCSPEMAS